MKSFVNTATPDTKAVPITKKVWKHPAAATLCFVDNISTTEMMPKDMIEETFIVTDLFYLFDMFNTII